ncbi:ADP-forming succinate--CoA ligase subunit beta [bacterium]|nr:ADP-forming succinate--CoA ligase subunit beta [bacterium]
MKIHEYQAKDIFAKYGIPVPPGKIAFTPDEVEDIASEIGGKVVVKAQVHVGGRGKAGGIKLADGGKDARAKAEQILGMDIKGLTVEKVLVTKAIDIRDEYYLGITLDRDARMLVLILSAAGGIDIEEVARETPEKIAKVNIDPLIGIQDYQITQAIFGSGVDTTKAREIRSIVRKLYNCYMAIDGSLAEINPLVVTTDGEVVALDAKINIDDNALFRQPELEKLMEVGADMDAIEAEARHKGIAYVHLSDGNVGVMGNGAGLVMTTMDVVSRAGGKPNNFLDIGGAATSEVVEEAFHLILMDPNVNGIFLNVFGGIVRCDVVAEGMIKAYEKLPRKVPVVLRMTGTNEEIARKMLEDTPLVYESSTETGAAKIVEMLGGQS